MLRVHYYTLPERIDFHILSAVSMGTKQSVRDGCIPPALEHTAPEWTPPHCADGSSPQRSPGPGAGSLRAGSSSGALTSVPSHRFGIWPFYKAAISRQFPTLHLHPWTTLLREAGRGCCFLSPLQVPYSVVGLFFCFALLLLPFLKPKQSVPSSQSCATP